MNLKYLIVCVILFLHCLQVKAQYIQSSTQKIIDETEQQLLHNQSIKALLLLEEGIKTTSLPADLAYLYAHQSGIYASIDSLLIAKRSADQSMKNARVSKKNTSLAVAYRSKAFLNNKLNLPDSVVKDALEGLRLIETTDEDPITKYHLHYLLYSVYSKWDNSEKMASYIYKAREYALKSNNINLQANVNNGISSMYLTRYRKEKKQNFLDSCFQYLNLSFDLQQKFPKSSGNTFVITCINLANYYLDHSLEDLDKKETNAFYYLSLAEKKLQANQAGSENWMNIYGIKSGFAIKRNNKELAEQYLLQGLSKLVVATGNYYRLEYKVNKDLAKMAADRNDMDAAYIYQQRAEDLLKKTFNEQQLFNAQKLEVQFETEKKDQNLLLSNQREEFRRRQNYFYAGIAIALLFGLVFMFVSYHFKLRYSKEREIKMSKEKEDAEQKAHILLKLEQEEQARLKAEQELLVLRRQQLEKEALANSLIIDRKNNTLKQIQHKIESGEAGNIQKLIKEEMLLQADFEEIKQQVHELHPDFFKRLGNKAVQNLTSLDLKYCTYLYLKMSTKQIAQALHIEPQSVRMFKYRLKQKFGLLKEDSLEDFLSE